MARTLVGESSGYSPLAGYLDELFAGPGKPRDYASALLASLEGIGRLELSNLGRRRDQVFTQQGITSEVAGADGASVNRPFPLDLVPRIVSAGEWGLIERGLTQRIRALNSFLADVYRNREIVRDGIVPWELVLGSPHFRRAVHGVRPPGGIFCHVSGCALVRDADGSWKVLEDN